MKQRRKLKVWHMIVLMVILVLIPISMFFPVLHLDRAAVEDVISDMRKEGEEAERYIEILEETLLQQVPEESASAWDVMTYDIPKEELSNDFVRKLDEKLWKIQIPMWFLYLGAVLFILLALVFFLIKRTKFVPVIGTGLYALAGIVGSSIFLWGIPGIVVNTMEDWMQEVLRQFGVISVFAEDYMGENAKYFELLDHLVSSLWTHVLSPGMYLSFGLFLILFVMLAVIGLTGNRRESVVQMYMGSPTGMIRWLHGELAGAELPVDSYPLYAGRDPRQCQLVLGSPYVDRVHFSIAYNGNGTYQVVCFSSKGLVIRSPQYGIGQMSKGMQCQLATGTQISLNQGEETFMLMEEGFD